MESFLKTTFWKKSSQWAPLLVVMAVVAYCWYATVVKLAIPLWAIPDDAPVMSLSHGVNIDYWLFGHHGGRALGQPQFYQPGFPFQIVSWIIYRIASPTPFGTPDQLFDQYVRDPSRFWFVIQLLPLLLSFLGLSLIWRASEKERTKPLVMLAVFASYFTASAAFHYGIDDFFNESFTLLFAAWFFVQAHTVFDERSADRLRPIAVSGLITGILYLHKMNYVVWGLAMTPALIMAGVVGRFTWKGVLARAGIFVACFLASLNVVGRAFLGTRGFRLMIQGHLEIFWGSGIYGNGSKTIVALETVKTNLQSLFTKEGFLLFLLAVTLLISLRLVVLHARENKWLREHLPEGTLLAAASAVMLLAVIKHYQPYYVVSFAAVIPFLLLWIARSGASKLLFILLLPVMALSIARGALTEFESRTLTVAAYQRTVQDEKDILATPLNTGEIRLWFYRVVGPVGSREFLVDFSSIPELQNRLFALQGNQLSASPWQTSIHYNNQTMPLSEAPWRDLVLDRDNLAWFDPKLQTWMSDPKISRTEMRQLVVYHRK